MYNKWYYYSSASRSFINELYGNTDRSILYDVFTVIGSYLSEFDDKEMEGISLIMNKPVLRKDIGFLVNLHVQHGKGRKWFQKIDGIGFDDNEDIHVSIDGKVAGIAVNFPCSKQLKKEKRHNPHLLPVIRSYPPVVLFNQDGYTEVKTFPWYPSFLMFSMERMMDVLRFCDVNFGSDIRESPIIAYVLKTSKEKLHTTYNYTINNWKRRGIIMSNGRAFSMDKMVKKDIKGSWMVKNF